ncbi:MAG: CRISPR-associated protein Cmr6, partial [Moorea sp. SIO3C2]|nr:CRISPR-associated protein Cmr6 [Moorena sp. SIO3C2]
ERLLGSLEGGIGCVQILDAFPIKPCLTVDMANPQWNWDNNQVTYQPVPHALLSMEKPELVIGLARTTRGSLEDVKTVKQWLEQALTEGIGSRVSAGYGRIAVDASLPCSCSHDFQLWTQGMYGAFPPSKENRQGTAEFRPTALRGMLRYWFRAIALGLYSPGDCKNLEATLFGTIEPPAREGKIRIALDWSEKKGDRFHPHFYEGTILLEAKEKSYLTLIEKLLHLASHLGGIGRGSRRPLHWNHPYPGLRGCYWQVDSKILTGNQKVWQDFRQEVIAAFTAVQPLSNPGAGNPGKPKHRQQDVLNDKARIYLLPFPGLKHPEAVKDWQIEGSEINVRGRALDLLYGSDRFKGVNQKGQGNDKVGGGLGTPSYVLIQSNFPPQQQPYQTVTIFGANQSDRSVFASEFQKLRAIPIHWKSRSKKIRHSHQNR